VGGWLEKVIAQLSNNRSSRPKRGSVYHLGTARQAHRSGSVAAGVWRGRFDLGRSALLQGRCGCTGLAVVGAVCCKWKPECRLGASRLKTATHSSQRGMAASGGCG
jgi:hypothetical protein